MNSTIMKMDPNLTNMWVSFFTAAGIPSDVSATYALTFTENRIQNDMLLDLNKEYLRDMGISRMGDVIAILRHAKLVHENTARDRVLSTTLATGGSKVPVAAVAGRLTAAASKSSSPASRILEHYTRKTVPVEAPVSTPDGPQIKRKIDISTDSNVDMKKSRLIRFGTPAPPSDGPVSKLTVFSRLGNSDVARNVAVDTCLAPKAIYSRLGAKNEQLKISSTPDLPVEQDALKYEGILKSSQVKKIVTVTASKDNVRKIAMTCTMRADETPLSVKEKLTMPKQKSVKFSNHVQYKEIEEEEAGQQDRVVQTGPVIAMPKFTSVFNKPERRLSMPVASPGVKARLGGKDANDIKITKNVFNRLGV